MLGGCSSRVSLAEAPSHGHSLWGWYLREKPGFQTQSTNLFVSLPRGVEPHGAIAPQHCLPGLPIGAERSLAFFPPFLFPLLQIY